MLPHYTEHAGTGPHALLVHGMLSSRAQWMLNIEALAEVCRPVVLELWGHGRSPAPDDPAAYRPDAYVETFERVREAVGAARWFTCGQSFGAALTLRYGLNYPERVIGQVFTNSMSALADEDTVAMYRKNAKARAEAVLRDGLAGLEKIPVHPKHARRLPAEVQAAMLEDAALHTPAGFANTFQNTSPYASVREPMRHNTLPTLLVCGVRERRFRPIRDFVARELPHTEIVDAEAGHAVNIQAADAFNAAVTDFVRRHTSEDAICALAEKP